MRYFFCNNLRLWASYLL